MHLFIGNLKSVEFQQTVTRRPVTTQLGWLLLLMFALVPNVRAWEAPNVVLVITDDQGHGDLSCHGNPVLKTPRLDELYGESVRFTDFHVSPTCSPSRGALMSGHYTNRAGTWHTIMGRSLLLEGETTLGEIFAIGGYATGIFGKWHLGDNYPFRPEDRGFHEVVRHGGGGVGQAPDHWDNAYFDDTYFHNGEPRKYQGYCTDVFFDEARRFIEASVANGKPFFAYVSTNTAHSPFHCPEAYIRPYRKLVDQPREAVFLGMIANIDENVGRLRDWLAAKDLAENTIFIFMTDNGTASGAKVFNSRMRGNKGSPYDGGHRVPCLVHWPAGGFDQPIDVDRLSAHIDILPTLQELCDLPSLDDYSLDGVSLVPLMRNPQTSWPDRTIITDSQRVRDPIKWRQSSTMTDRWRLVNGKELFDISSDPGQARNVADRHPTVVARLREAYEAWWEDISPAFEKVARIVVGHPAENPSYLSSHDWLTNENAVPWNQSQIRNGQSGQGHWALRVEASGPYRISLRRWPTSVSQPISAGLPPGDSVPGLKAFRETVGKRLLAEKAGLRFGDTVLEQLVSTGADSVEFDVRLEPGPIDLQGYFVLSDESEMGAYYAVVEAM